MGGEAEEVDVKLIDLLVQELPKRGGWAKSLKDISYADHGISWMMPPWGCSPICYRLASHEIVTREQYQAAITSSQQPEWDGEGLPPVGCECEVKRAVDWMRCKILFISEMHVVLLGEEECCWNTCACMFRPLRSEEERKRDDVIKYMSHSLRANGSITDEQLNRLYHDISTGLIPHIILK